MNVGNRANLFCLLNAILVTFVKVGFEQGNCSVDIAMMNYSVE